MLLNHFLSITFFFFSYCRLLLGFNGQSTPTQNRLQPCCPLLKSLYFSKMIRLVSWELWGAGETEGQVWGLSAAQPLQQPGWLLAPPLVGTFCPSGFLRQQPSLRRQGPRGSGTCRQPGGCDVAAAHSAPTATALGCRDPGDAALSQNIPSPV